MPLPQLIPTPAATDPLRRSSLAFGRIDLPAAWANPAVRQKATDRIPIFLMIFMVLILFRFVSCGSRASQGCGAAKSYRVASFGVNTFELRVKIFRSHPP